MRNPFTVPSFRILILPLAFIIIGCWIYFAGRDMPEDYFSKRIEKNEAESEDLLLKQYLPDSIYNAQVDSTEE